MNDNLFSEKQALRAEAKRARGLLSLDAAQQDNLCALFFEHINVNDTMSVGAYWPKGRELNTLILIEALIEKGVKVAIPVIQPESRVLKFARWHDGISMVNGLFDIPHPVIDDKTQWLEPDIFLVPLLAFDRQGYRLGYGGGYYDSTLDHYKQNKKITAVGLGYAKQACLFSLPKEDHDVKMDWIITEQNATRF